MNPDDAGNSTRNQRRARLAASLRENLKRRKAQQRFRAAETAPPASKDDPPSDRARGAPRTKRSARSKLSLKRFRRRKDKKWIGFKFGAGRSSTA